MSILRDSWVDIPGYGYNKVNAALAYGGLPLTIRTVEQMIDAPINQVGGHRLLRLQGPDYRTRRRDGEQRAGVLRLWLHVQEGRDHRQGRPGSPLRARASRVQQRRLPAGEEPAGLLKGVLSKLLDKGTLSNPITISNTINSISPYLTTTKGLDAAYLAGLAWDMRTIKLSDVHTFTEPTAGTGYEGAQSVVYVDQAKLKDLQHLYRADALEKYKRDVTPS